MLEPMWDIRHPRRKKATKKDVMNLLDIMYEMLHTLCAKED
jgi:hypothetical protein